MARPADARSSSHLDPRLEAGVRLVALTGLSLVLLLPAGRGSTEWLGWTPLWLAGMPLMAWWALHRFRLPSWPARRRVAVIASHRLQPVVQARRRRPVAAKATRRALRSRAA